MGLSATVFSGLCRYRISPYPNNNKAAYDESGRAGEIDATLNRLLMIVQRIHLIEEFPANLSASRLENVKCAAINLCASIMNYLAPALKTLQRNFPGILPYRIWLLI